MMIEKINELFNKIINEKEVEYTGEKIEQIKNEKQYIESIVSQTNYIQNNDKMDERFEKFLKSKNRVDLIEFLKLISKQYENDYEIHHTLSGIIKIIKIFRGGKAHNYIGNSSDFDIIDFDKRIN